MALSAGLAAPIAAPRVAGGVPDRMTSSAYRVCVGEAGLNQADLDVYVEFAVRRGGRQSLQGNGKRQEGGNEQAVGGSRHRR